jgi:GNAT superfamily N-acetyltransferase
VISRQLALYRREHGFTSETWKAYLTDGVRHFVEQFDGRRDCMYILERDGVPSGCVAITHVDEATAQLRFFFLEPDARGIGAGHRLLDMAIDFCRDAGKAKRRLSARSRMPWQHAISRCRSHQQAYGR